MQGLFSLMQSFEAISEPAVQRQLLEHSLQLLDLSRGSRVRLLRHEARSAEQLMELLRDHAPETLQDDHLLMLQGPVQDMVLPCFYPCTSCTRLVLLELSTSMTHGSSCMSLPRHEATGWVGWCTHPLTHHQPPPSPKIPFRPATSLWHHRLRSRPTVANDVYF